MNDSHPRKSKLRPATIAILFAVSIATGLLAFSLVGRFVSQAASTAEPPPAASLSDLADDAVRTSSIEEVLEIANAALVKMSTSCDDYTARFVKQELNSGGDLSEFSEIQLKIQTRLRNDTDDAAKRVYLNFTKPENVNGREVIWAEDLHDGIHVLQTSLAAGETVQQVSRQVRRVTRSWDKVTPQLAKMSERDQRDLAYLRSQIEPSMVKLKLVFSR